MLAMGNAISEKLTGNFRNPTDVASVGSQGGVSISSEAAFKAPSMTQVGTTS